MSGEGKTVCVTGASGFIASWLVKLLLQRGYTVRASVRDPSDQKKTDHLLALDGAKERLRLFKANLLEEGSFDSVVDGCEEKDLKHMIYKSHHELIEPALNGTLNVLGSCAKNPTVKRVVLTSSVAAVAYNGRPRTSDVIIDETWFSDPESCKENKNKQRLSKTLAEDAAWKFAKENGIDMVAINPAMVIGPLLQPTLNTSSAAILNLINDHQFSNGGLGRSDEAGDKMGRANEAGEELERANKARGQRREEVAVVAVAGGGSQTYPNASFGWINVKDVANAHIQAYEIPSANGRYCLVERVAHYSEVVNILHKLYPSFQLPEKSADDKPFMPTYQVSREKAKTLGIDFISLEEGLKETVESLTEKKFFGM
ncbi:unnamed protein product [Camellia sinensis]